MAPTATSQRARPVRGNQLRDGPDLADHVRYCTGTPRLLREDVTAGFFRRRTAAGLAGIIAPVVPVLIGWLPRRRRCSPMVATPIFYAITAEGLRGPRAAASSARSGECRPARTPAQPRMYRR